MTDKLTAEYLELTPTQWLDMTLDYFDKRFLAADKKEAFDRLIRAASALIEEEEEEEIPRLLPLSQFMEETGEPPESVVAEFLPAQKLILLGGAAKEGKSLVALEFLHCVSIGGKLMDAFEIKRPMVVAYFGMEDGAHEIKARLIARGATDIENFFVCSTAFDMATPAGFETFKRLVSELPTPPGLVIIDTAREAFSSMADWNKAEVVGPRISPLRKWAHKNCSVILVAHTNKDKFATGVNKFSGSTALVSSCDSYMLLEGQTVLDSGNLRWKWEMGGRSVRKANHVLEMDTNTLHVRALDSQETEQAKNETKQGERRELKTRIARYADNVEDFSLSPLASDLQLPYKFVYTLVKEMEDAKEVCKTGRTIKIEGAGRPSPLYALTEQGRNNYLFPHTVLGQCAEINNSEAHKPDVDDFMRDGDSDEEADEEEGWK